MRFLFKDFFSLFTNLQNYPKNNLTKTEINKNKVRYRSQRTRNLYHPTSNKSYKLSRSKLELFLRCARCFYLDRKLGVNQPPGYPFSLNIAVDKLLKKEFDKYRAEQRPHPLCLENNIEAIPFKHDNVEKWRNSLHAGIKYVVPNTNIMLYGGLDDVWINTKTKELFIVDYKATSKTGAVSLDAAWQISYKRQIEIYQWLLRKNNFLVSNTAFFVYCNAKANLDDFDKKLLFDVSILPYEGDDSWVESAVNSAYQCLQSTNIPPVTDTCEYCQYWQSINKHLN